MWKAPQDRALWGSEPWGPAWTGPGDICELGGRGALTGTEDGKQLLA